MNILNLIFRNRRTDIKKADKKEPEESINTADLFCLFNTEDPSLYQPSDAYRKALLKVNEKDLYALIELIKSSLEHPIDAKLRAAELTVLNKRIYITRRGIEHFLDLSYSHIAGAFSELGQKIDYLIKNDPYTLEEQFNDQFKAFLKNTKSIVDYPIEHVTTYCTQHKIVFNEESFTKVIGMFNDQCDEMRGFVLSKYKSFTKVTQNSVKESYLDAIEMVRIKTIDMLLKALDEAFPPDMLRFNTSTLTFRAVAKKESPIDGNEKDSDVLASLTKDDIKN